MAMTRFVLVDAANFVLLASPAETAERVALGELAYLNPVFAKVVRLLDLDRVAAELSSRVAFNDASALEMRRILERYGFDLPPQTVGELCGLFEYCDRLDASTGTGIFATHQQRQWQELSFALDPSGRSPSRRALALYACGDTQGLRTFHRDERTLVRLGWQDRAPED
jgi:hypothetical protein